MAPTKRGRPRHRRGRGRPPRRPTPSWDFTTLWVNSDKGGALTPVDPRTGKVGRSVPVRDPYNLYFTPGGEHALVMASKSRAIDVLDPRTMKPVQSLPVPGCAGIDHADYSADLSFFVASCEFNGRLLSSPATRPGSSRSSTSTPSRLRERHPQSTPA